MIRSRLIMIAVRGRQDLDHQLGSTYDAFGILHLLLIADDKYIYDFGRSVTSDLTLYAAWLNEQKYHLIVKGEGGTISVDKEFAVFPEEVTFTVVPDPGYKLWYIHNAPHWESVFTCELDNIYPKEVKQWQTRHINSECTRMTNRKFCLPKPLGVSDWYIIIGLIEK